MCSVPSAESLATTKVAIIACNEPELKREILCASGSEYKQNINHSSIVDERKELWIVIIKRKAPVILENLGLPKTLHEVVISTIFLVGIRMLDWAKYHESILSLEREYSVNFLNSSFFTQLGTINNKKAAETFIIDQHLSIQQRYKLACLYCFTVDINELYTKMTFEEWEMFYNAQDPNIIDQPKIVKFWSYSLKNDVDKLMGDQNFGQYLLELTVDSGSQAAVEYYLETANVRENSNALLAAAVETVKYERILEDGWHAFRDERYSESLWVPTEYYVDILYSLLLKMSDDQKKDFLMNGIRGQYTDDDDGRYRTLEYFLYWPYQNYFIRLGKLMLENSLEENYAFQAVGYAMMLLKICERIELQKQCLIFGHEKTFSYNQLFKEFWNLSPERFKRYVFSDYQDVDVQYGVEILIHLISQKSFTSQDKKFIQLFLSSATSSEKENILFSAQLRRFCYALIEEEQWEILYRFELNTCLSEDTSDRFKAELSFTKEVQCFCIDFILNDNWESVDVFIEWSALSDEDLSKLKKEIIHSPDGRKACVEIIIDRKNVEAFEKFVTWCFVSEEERKAFKREFLFSSEDIFRCENLIDKNQLQTLNEVINSCLFSEEDITRLKKNVAYKEGLKVCEMLITGDQKKHIYIADYMTSRSSNFEGGEWDEVEDFLNWCFSSEEEKSEFKKKHLFKELGKKIHFNLIKSREWIQAETFIAWVGLSAEEIKQLKKESLFDYNPTVVMLRELMYMEDDERFDFRSKQAEIDLFLKWYLTDQETVLEFKDMFKRWHCREQKAMFEEFDLAIEQHVSDLERMNSNENEEF